ncbi:MAG: UDP-N-acetylmuramoyl-tripeptide--D-alanyl-D-alanine ligase [Clostridia bacterium]|nr:UDP-N-acetylmuramoyl-tripeptide--D-alanyl-D-alanine ligase [Clostridia bacterium]
MRIDLCKSLQDPAILAVALGARRKGTAPVVGIATNSEEVKKNDIFIALPGEKSDGNDYVMAALEKGASGVITAQNIDWPCMRFMVRDPIQALLRAAFFRRRKSNAYVIAVSGSTGKTTVKEAVSHILAECGSVEKTAGNYNSMIGLPLSILSFENAQFWVLELGINHPGEMEQLSKAALPDLAVLTNVGNAHIGNFESWEQLRQEKMKITAGLCRDGCVIVPNDLPTIGLRCPPAAICRIGEKEGGDFYMDALSVGQNGIRGRLVCPHRVIEDLRWPIPGRTGISTMAIASAVGVLAGCSDRSIREGLKKAGEHAPRIKQEKHGERIFIDDSYNASPESMAAALEFLSIRGKGRQTVAVLGDMLELGPYSKSFHLQAGEAAVKNGVSMLFTYGTGALRYAEGARKAGMPQHAIRTFLQGEEKAMVAALKKCIEPHAVVLFKASRAMKIEKVKEMLGGQI